MIGDILDIPVTAEEEGDLRKVVEIHPMNIPRYYLSLVDSENRLDPIRKQCIPDAQELIVAGGAMGETTKAAKIMEKIASTGPLPTVEPKKKEGPKIEIYKAWCKACGICVAFCPAGALAKDEAGYPYVNDIKKCINCGWCEIRCPDFALTVESKAKDKKKGEERVGEKDPKGEQVSPEGSVA